MSRITRSSSRCSSTKGFNDTDLSVTSENPRKALVEISNRHDDEFPTSRTVKCEDSKKHRENIISCARPSKEDTWWKDHIKSPKKSSPAPVDEKENCGSALEKKPKQHLKAGKRLPGSKVHRLLPSSTSLLNRTARAQTNVQSRRVPGKRNRNGIGELIEPKAKALRHSANFLKVEFDDKFANRGIYRRDTGARILGDSCGDLLRASDHSMVRVPFHPAQYTTGLSRHDFEKRRDVLEVSSYATDIYQRLYNAESMTSPHPYMDRQPALNSKMRGILVDWLIEVHLKFRLVPETLYLCINIMDRYLALVQVERQRLQLVGVTSLLVACKYEEIYPPEVKDCVYITDRAYTRQDVIDMEAHIMKVLHFRLTVPTAYPFLQRFLSVTNATRTMKIIANYYMERMLQEYCILSYRPSLVATAAVSLALNNPDVLEHEGIDAHTTPGLPPILMQYTKYEQKDILEVANIIAHKVSENVTTTSRRQLNSVRKKYESDRFCNVSVAFMEPDISHLISM